jgi:hypothetical protein
MFEELSVTQLVNKYLAFYIKPKMYVVLPCSEEPVTGSYVSQIKPVFVIISLDYTIYLKSILIM